MRTVCNEGWHIRGILGPTFGRWNYHGCLHEASDSYDGDQQEEEGVCPIYMENSVALMIKKMFCRLKGFTERMA